VPVLDQHRFKASFWVIPGYVAAGGEYMDWSDLNALVANSRYEVQSHSFTHPLSPGSLLGWMEGRVRGKGPADVRAELVLSKRVLEARLGRPVHYLAWPLGLYNDAMVELARQVSYKAVLTSDELPGNEVGGDIFRIRRMSVPGTCDLAVFAARLTAFAAQLPEFSRHRC